MNIAEVVAYDPNAPMANMPIAIIDEENVVAVPPDDEEIQMIKNLDEIEDRLADLYDDGEMTLECYSELGYYFSLISENKWYRKVEKRMNGRRMVVKPRLTDQQKAESPDYMLCVCCVEYVEKDYYRRVHIHLAKHKKNEIARNMRRTNDKVKKVDASFIYNAKKVNDGIDRLITLMKNKQPELEEEQILEEDNHIVSITAEEQEENDATANIYEEDEDIVYVVKTWDKYGEYAGLFEVDGVKQWDDLEEATEKYGWAIDCGDMEAVELVKIDPNSEDRETIIYDWEGEVEEEEVYGVCIGCNQEGKFIGKEGDDWTCMNCLEPEEEVEEEEKVICCLNCGLKKTTTEDIKNYYCEPICMGF